jgi:hypothetical protein
VNRNEGCVGHQVPIRREQCAREVQPFLDVRADRGLLQGATHRFSDAHEAIRKESKQNGIGSKPWTVGRIAAGHSRIGVMCGVLQVAPSAKIPPEFRGERKLMMLYLLPRNMYPVENKTLACETLENQWAQCWQQVGSASC